MIFGLVCLVVIIALAAYMEPYYNGVGVVICVMGLPFYYVSKYYNTREQSHSMGTYIHVYLNFKNSNVILDA